MKFTLATMAALFGMALAQGVTQRLTPTGAAPAGCTGSFNGNFEVSVNGMTQKRDVSQHKDAVPHVEKRAACGGPGTLVLTLQNGVLLDSSGRTGYIAANRQFQFDAPVQAGAIYTAGWSVCGDNNLALGSSKTFYQCLSGNFYNLYDQTQGGQCQMINIMAIPCSGPAGTSAASMAPSSSRPAMSGGTMSMPTGATTMARMTQITDGQIQAPTARVSQISDGQIQASSAARVSQITDGQIQASSAARVSQITDGQIQASSAARVSQITDGQIQASSAARVSQITDGQIQASSAARVSQITDGQIQASSAARVSQITDGQIQASRSVTSAARVSQITDGQIQASSAARVSQITDGQIQASRSVTSSAARVSQITDGQIQASSAARVSQITDGQIQASRTTAAPASTSRVVVAAEAGTVSFSLGGLVLAMAVALFGF